MAVYQERLVGDRVEFEAHLSGFRERRRTDHERIDDRVYVAGVREEREPVDRVGSLVWRGQPLEIGGLVDRLRDRPGHRYLRAVGSRPLPSCAWSSSHSSEAVECRSSIWFLVMIPEWE